MGHVCGGKETKKEKKKKENEDMERRRAGTCAVEKNPRGKKEKRLLGCAKFVTDHKDFDKF